MTPLDYLLMLFVGHMLLPTPTSFVPEGLEPGDEHLALAVLILQNKVLWALSI